MQRTSILAAASAALALSTLGCGSSAEMADASQAESAAPVELPQVAGTTAPFNEWKKIYSVESLGGKTNRKHVGYLHRIFSEEDPEGKYYVKDLRHDTRGFLLPEGKAFAMDILSSSETPRFRDLGNTGRANGVKKILDVHGEVQFEAVPTSLPTSPPASARAGEPAKSKS